MSDDDTADVLCDIAPKAAGKPAGESDPAPVSRHQAVARAAVRGANGQFLSEGKGQGRHERKRPDGPKPGAVPRRKSRVTSGSALFFNGNAVTPQARRFADILAAICNDLGGAACLSEGQKQLARRAAALSVSCEVLEQTICTNSASAAEAALGLSSYQILRDACRAMHGVGRSLGGNTISEMARLPPEKLDRVVDLLSRAGDLASKCVSAGSAQSADLQLLGELSDRLGRTFGRLGLARIPREINGGRLSVLPYARNGEQSEAWSPLRDAIARDTQDVPQDQDALAPLDVNSEGAQAE